jgi:hypothetical protein
MTLYRDTITGRIWTDGELTTSLAQAIDALEDEDSLKQDVELHGDAAIREYIVECCLVRLYSRVDDGEEFAYRRTVDGHVFYAAEMEDVFSDDIATLDPEPHEQVTFDGWLTDVVVRGLFEPIDA